MNFSGTYRSTSTLSGGSDSDGDETISTRETVGSYSSSNYRYSGNLSHSPVVLDSVQIQLGGITFTGDGSGNLVSDYGSGKVTIAGAWSVDLNGNSESSSMVEQTVSNEPLDGNFSTTTKGWILGNHPIVPGSVRINGSSVSEHFNFHDDGEGNMIDDSNGQNGGHVVYKTGAVSVSLSGNPGNMDVTASYNYYVSQDGAPFEFGSGEIIAVYSYTAGGTTSGASIATTSSDITSITVSQSGQNLVMTTNTGVQMSGKFTAVRETSDGGEDANATYNAQFQVTSSSGHKFVGTLNHDLVTRHCTLNGTLTHGKATYDVQGVGPAFSTAATTTE